MKPFWGILCIFWLLILPMVAFCDANATDTSELSEEDRDRALVHFQKGDARFSQKEYLLAIEHFKLAYDITESPEILYNIAMCYEELQETELAVEHYNAYLRKTDGSDATEVKEVQKKILDLGGKVESAPPTGDASQDGADVETDVTDDTHENDDTGKKGTKRLDHFALELGMGPGFVLLTPNTGSSEVGTNPSDPNKNNYFSIDVLGHFYLSDWFAITGVILMGPYMEGKDSRFIARDPKSHIGIGIGIGMKKNLQKRASLFTNLLASACSIKRENITKRATWFAIDVRFGLNIMITPGFSLNLMAVAEGGPAMVINPSGQDWENGMLLSVGPRVGFTYAVNKE